MSVFSLIKRGRQQAKEHNAKQAKQTEKAKEDPPKQAYKHVVSHAAIDALATAPSSWKHDDRPKIMEQNKRRSAMASNGNGSGMPRVGSSLSYVSYPSVYATPVVPLPKNYSYSSIPSSWREKMTTTPGSVPSPDGSEYFSYSASMKGKEREILPPILGGAMTPMSNKGAGVSFAGSSGNSSSSEEELEIRRKPPVSLFNTHQSRLSRQSTSNNEQTHRLPAHPRSNPESSGSRQYPPQAKSTFFTAPRPLDGRALSMDMTIPPVPNLPEQYASLVSSQSTSSQLSSSSSTNSTAGAISTAPSSVASTIMSSTADDIISPKQKSHASSVAPVVARQHETTESRKASVDTVLGVAPSESTSKVISQSQPQPQPQPQSPQKSRRRLSKSRPPKSTEMEVPASSKQSAVRMSVETVRPRRPSIFSSVTAFQNPKAEPQLAESPTIPAPDVSRRRLSKTPSETTAKRRWSLRGSKTPTVTA
ncbi:hypothetical protein F5X96DRAFT_681653 [Biscogniauxia mediterranea]|nr:hypothetical protein F5X96DRAFT_681653 [Biscogniauxia mediterranea]